MADQIPLGQLLANRHVVGLGLSRKAPRSWLPASPEESSTTLHSDDEDTTKALDDDVGIGTSTTEERLPEAVVRQEAKNDKLLEHLLGKKAAQARKKSQQEAASKHTASTPMAVAKPTVGSQREDSEDEDGAGRAAAFTSRNRKVPDSKAPTNATLRNDADDAVEQNAKPPGPSKGLTAFKDMAAQEDKEEEERPRKRKAGSYMDELLAQKAKKKKKSKKRADAAG